MKKLTILMLLLFTGVLFAQKQTATTKDGKEVLLNEDKTWEYIDSEKVEESSSTCNLGSDFKVPKITKNVKRLISHVSVANECAIEDIIVISYSEGKGNGMYNLCVNGVKMKYRMVGSAFLKADTDPFSGN